MVGCGRTAGDGVGEMGWRLFGSVDKRWKEERETERERERERERTRFLQLVNVQEGNLGRYKISTAKSSNDLIPLSDSCGINHRSSSFIDLQISLNSRTL